MFSTIYKNTLMTIYNYIKLFLLNATNKEIRTNYAWSCIQP